MTRTMLVVAVAAVVVALVAADSHPMPNKGIWNAYRPMTGRPLPGQNEKQSDQTAMDLQASFVAMGPAPDSPRPTQEAINEAIASMMNDLGLFGPGGALNEFEFVPRRSDIYPRDNKAANEWGIIGRILLFRKDGGTFDMEAAKALKEALDSAANMNTDLTNARLGALGLSMVKVKRNWDEKEGRYEADAHVLAFHDAGAPLMAPGARVRFNGEFDGAQEVRGEDIGHYLPMIMTGCLEERLMYAGINDAHFSPAYFKFIRSASRAFPEGVRTWFAMTLDVPQFEGSDKAAEFAAMFLQECFDSQMQEVMMFVTGQQVDARMFEPEVEAFVRPARFRKRDNTGFTIVLIGDETPMRDLMNPMYEKMHIGIVEAGNSAIEYNIMHGMGDPMGPRLNATNFEITGYGITNLGLLGFRGAITCRVLGADDVDFPELTPQVHSIMSQTLSEFYGIPAIVLPIMGGETNDDYQLLDIGVKVSGLTHGNLKADYAEADLRVKALLMTAVHNALKPFNTDNNKASAIPPAQVGSGAQSGFVRNADGTSIFFFTTFAMVHSSYADAAKAAVADAMDEFELAIRADGSVSVLIDIATWSKDMPPPGIAGASDTFVASFGLAGVQEANLDVDAFAIVVETLINAKLMDMAAANLAGLVGPRSTRLIGCHWQREQSAAGDMKYARCQLELRLKPDFVTAATVGALSTMINAAIVGAKPAFDGAWGSNAQFFPCSTCGVRYREKKDSVMAGGQMYAELSFAYKNFKIEEFTPNDGSNGARKSLYYAAVVSALREIGVNDVTDGDLYIHFGDSGSKGRRLNHMSEYSEIAVRVPVPDEQSKNALKNAEIDLAHKIEGFIKQQGGFHPYADIPDSPPGPACIPSVFKFDRMDGSGAHVATNDCYAMFPSDRCDNAQEIDDGRGNKYKLMGPWSSYSHLQSCHN